MARPAVSLRPAHYNPAIGPFTQQDPLDQITDLRQGDRYLYAGNDPVNLIDPSGLPIFEDIGYKAEAAVEALGQAAHKRLYCAGVIVSLTAAGAVGGSSLGPSGTAGGARLGLAAGTVLCGALHASMFLRDNA